ncbi:MAG: methyltransferase domain-containing protein [Verrucomicrobiota bacterium]
MMPSKKLPEELKRFLKRFAVLRALARTLRHARAKYERIRATSPRVYSRQIEEYDRGHRLRKLQIGSGPNALAGWLNTDSYPVSRESVFMDATRAFPLASQTFDYVFSEHVIEHLSYEEGLFMLRESFRVLKPAGRIRIATPNLKNLIDLYSPEKTGRQRRYIKWAMNEYWPHLNTSQECFIINNFVRNWGHKFIYDPAALQGALERAGFIAVSEHSPGESNDEHLSGLESHGKLIGEEFNGLETMVLEAKRP